MNVAEMQSILNLISVPEFEFKLHAEKGHASHAEPSYYLQGHYTEADVVSGLPEPQSTRKWLLSVHMTKSELVQTAFKCYLTSMEHQARESFRYRGKRIFGPHYDVDVLAEIVGKDANLDYRRAG